MGTYKILPVNQNKVYLVSVNDTVNNNGFELVIPYHPTAINHSILTVVESNDEHRNENLKNPEQEQSLKTLEFKRKNSGINNLNASVLNNPEVVNFREHSINFTRQYNINTNLDKFITRISLQTESYQRNKRHLIGNKLKPSKAINQLIELDSFYKSIIVSELNNMSSSYENFMTTFNNKYDGKYEAKLLDNSCFDPIKYPKIFKTKEYLKGFEEENSKPEMKSIDEVGDERMNFLQDCEQKAVKRIKSKMLRLNKNYTGFTKQSLHDGYSLNTKSLIKKKHHGKKLVSRNVCVSFRSLCPTKCTCFETKHIKSAVSSKTISIKNACTKSSTCSSNSKRTTKTSTKKLSTTANCRSSTVCKKTTTRISCLRCEINDTELKSTPQTTSHFNYTNATTNEEETESIPSSTSQASSTTIDLSSTTIDKVNQITTVETSSTSQETTSASNENTTLTFSIEMKTHKTQSYETSRSHKTQSMKPKLDEFTTKNNIIFIPNNSSNEYVTDFIHYLLNDQTMNETNKNTSDCEFTPKKHKLVQPFYLIPADKLNKMMEFYLKNHIINSTEEPNCNTTIVPNTTLSTLSTQVVTECSCDSPTTCNCRTKTTRCTTKTCRMSNRSTITKPYNPNNCTTADNKHSSTFTTNVCTTSNNYITTYTDKSNNQSKIVGYLVFLPSIPNSQPFECPKAHNTNSKNQTQLRIDGSVVIPQNLLFHTAPKSATLASINRELFHEDHSLDKLLYFMTPRYDKVYTRGIWLNGHRFTMPQRCKAQEIRNRPNMLIDRRLPSRKYNGKNFISSNARYKSIKFFLPSLNGYNKKRTNHSLLHQNALQV